MIEIVTYKNSERDMPILNEPELCLRTYYDKRKKKLVILDDRCDDIPSSCIELPCREYMEYQAMRCMWHHLGKPSTTFPGVSKFTDYIMQYGHMDEYFDIERKCAIRILKKWEEETGASLDWDNVAVKVIEI